MSHIARIFGSDSTIAIACARVEKRMSDWKGAPRWFLVTAVAVLTALALAGGGWIWSEDHRAITANEQATISNATAARANTERIARLEEVIRARDAHLRELLQTFHQDMSRQLDGLEEWLKRVEAKIDRGIK